MKRMQLFEFEDFAWFPTSLRDCLTRFIVTMHRLLSTHDDLAALLSRALVHTDSKHVFDMCSGGGGPLPEVLHALRRREELADVGLSLSDLYPNATAAAAINTAGDERTRYLTTPVNAAAPGDVASGVRTMICSLHHMPPDVARSILASAQADRAPFCAFEISDNSFPRPLWWIALVPNFIMVFFVTPLVRPMTCQQLVFTYLIPILPLLIAWDGAVSNARTYTVDDIDELLGGPQSDTYTWERGTVGGKVKKLYLLGLPVSGDGAKGA